MKGPNNARHVPQPGILLPNAGEQAALQQMQRAANQQIVNMMVVSIAAQLAQADYTRAAGVPEALNPEAVAQATRQYVTALAASVGIKLLDHPE